MSHLMKEHIQGRMVYLNTYFLSISGMQPVGHGTNQNGWQSWTGSWVQGLGPEAP